MTNKDGGAEADITVSVLENGDGSSIIKPKFEGEHCNRIIMITNFFLLYCKIFPKKYCWCEKFFIDFVGQFFSNTQLLKSG